uniref:Uncharacterized protein n=1 Tax=viral metagenome TaxID=1070528 RepID=A0A6C0ESN3_9ZZZZ
MPLIFKEVGFLSLNERCLIVSQDGKTCCIASFKKYNMDTTLAAEFINVISININEIENGILSFNPNIKKGTIKTYTYSSCSYFVLSSQKEKIQDAMELRAVNKILQRLINEMFLY